MFFVLFHFFVSVFAKNETKEFQQIFLKDGLSQSTVRSVCRDSKGFLWIGTLDGLNRYDGEKMKIYSGSLHKENKQLNLIYFVVEDKESRLWIGCNKGLFHLDRGQDKLVYVDHPDSALTYSAYAVNDREIIFLSQDRLLRYSFENGRMSVLPFKGKAAKLSFALKMVCMQERYAVIGDRWNGLFVCDLQNGTLTRRESPDLKYVTDVLLDADDNLWVSTFGNGIIKYNAKGVRQKHLKKEFGNLPNDVVMDIALLSDGKLWIATDGDGLCRYHQQKNTIETVENSYGSIVPSSVNSISCIAEDKYNNVWVGTLRNGLLGLKDKHINSFSSAYLHSPYGLSSSTATSFTHDQDAVWVSTDGNGINRFDPVKKLFTHYPSTFKMKISAVCNISDQELIFSEYRGGIYKFNKRTGLISRMPVSEQLKQRMQTSWLSPNMKAVNNRHSLLALDSLYLLDNQTAHTLTVVLNGTDDYEKGLKFGQGANNRILLFGNQVVYHYDAAANKLNAAFHIKDQGLGMLRAVAQQDDQTYWFCTNTGLYSYNLSDGTYKEEAADKGMLSPSVLAFSDDQKLWIGALDNIYRLDPLTRKMIVYGASEGASANEYTGKSFMTDDSTLYFGGTTGFSQINTHISFDSCSFVAPDVAEVFVNGKNVPCESNSTLQIPPGLESLNIRVIVNDKDLFKKRHYRYKLLRGDEEIASESVKGASFSFGKLLPGDYTLLVQYNLNNGEWSPLTRLTDFYVSPFWWDTIWFRIAVLLAVFLFILVSVRRIREKQKRVVEKQLSEYKMNETEQKIRFLININHELRTPLTLILSPFNRIKDQIDELSHSELKRLLTNTGRHAERMKEVIDMILQMRKSESEENNYVSVNLPHWVNEIVDSFRDELKARQLNLTVYNKLETGEVMMDEQKIRIVVVNLISNAIKYSYEEGDIQVFISQNATQISIRVADRGIGLKGIDQSKLFTRFYRGAREAEGFGIGLSYCKLLLEQLGGTIGAAENEGGGAVFTATFPYNAVPGSREEMDVAASYPDLIRSRNLNELRSYPDINLLVAEDEEELLAFFQEELSPYFRKVFTAADGVQAMEVLEKNAIDIILSDVMMPLKNGYEFCQELKQSESYAHIPVILLTALSGPEYSSEGYKCGADAYLTKPFEVEDLLYMVSNMLRTRDSLKARFKESGYNLLPHELSASDKDEKFIKKLIVLIEENMDRADLDVEQLSVMLGISRTGLYSRVKQLIGVGVKEFVNSVRIKKAASLLAETDYTIGEIAEMVGFSNQRYFSTVFKGETEMTPTEYRSQHKKTKTEANA